MAILYSKDVKMTAVLEKIVAIFAPHVCVVCGAEDNIACEMCLPQVFAAPQSACVLCAKPTVDWQVCQTCAKISSLSMLWPATLHEGKAADILRRFKFERVQAAYQPLAQALDNALPYINPEVVVVPLPTAPSRVRQRGYDQTLLIAKAFAARRGLTLATPLLRRHNLRQVGADRAARFAQASTAYEIIDPTLVQNQGVLLIDDICTTGASLNAAAKVLRAAGAQEVAAAVVAWQNKQK